MRSRTLGWIQDAGELNKLRKVVEVFKLSDRPLDIVESQKLVGISLDIGRWADNTYVRLAEALGFIEYNRETDDFSLTELGIDLLNSEPNSMAERTIFEKGLLSYPPACRILELLVNYGHLTKFDIAKNLGFSGERGFTLYGKENFIKEYHLAPNKSAKNKIISYKEGTADKYARMIAHYLIQMGWVESVEMDLKYEEAGAVYSARTPHAYRITDQGRKAYRRALGASIQNKVTKNVSFEMLASGKMAGYKILRKRRSLILTHLLKKKGKEVPLNEILLFLEHNGLKSKEEEVENDLRGLINTGILIQRVSNFVILKEKINLNIPTFAEEIVKLGEKIKKLIVNLKSTLVNIDSQFIEQIIQEAYSGKLKARDFEKSVHRLYTEIIGFEGIPLGGPDEPDSLFWYHAKTKKDSYGLIVDAKAYSGGFTITSSIQRAMVSYIHNFKSKLEKNHNVNRSHYLWVTSESKDTQKRLDYHTQQIEGILKVKGAVMPIDSSIFLAEKIKGSNREDILMEIEPLFYSKTIVVPKMIKQILG